MDKKQIKELDNEQIEAVIGGIIVGEPGAPQAAFHVPAEINLPLNTVVKPAGVLMPVDTELDGNHAKVGIFKWFKSLFGNL